MTIMIYRLTDLQLDTNLMKKLCDTAIAITFQAVVLFTISQAARADNVINYSVEIVEDGPVAAGSVINWNISATVATSDATNFGIAIAAIDLQDSFFETLNPGAIDDTFLSAGYGFPRGGDFNETTNKLENIGTFQDPQSGTTLGGDPSNGGSLGPFVLASGSYTVNVVGLHTLSTVPSASLSRFFTAAGQTLGDSSVYDDVTFGSDTILVVPEPGSGIVLLSLGLIGLIRRRK